MPTPPYISFSFPIYLCLRRSPFRSALYLFTSLLSLPLWLSPIRLTLISRPFSWLPTPLLCSLASLTTSLCSRPSMTPLPTNISRTYACLKRSCGISISITIGLLTYSPSRPLSPSVRYSSSSSLMAPSLSSTYALSLCALALVTPTPRAI